MSLGPRKEQILKAVVDQYIRSAEPVASKQLLEHWALNVSSATIRNEMAELETMGLLEQPHTSAGRVPSPAGYRYYVDQLMGKTGLSTSDREHIDSALKHKVESLERLLAEAGKLAAEITRHPAYALTPTQRYDSFERFVLFASDLLTVVCVVVMAGQQVNSRVVRHGEPVIESALAQLTAALNELLTGLRYDQITPELYDRLEKRSLDGRAYLRAVMVFLADLHGQEEQLRVVVEGSMHLFEHPEYRDIAKAHRMLSYLSDKKNLATLPQPYPTASRGVEIVIGPENVAAALQDASVVMATYHVGEMQGFIGLIGPTRMDYQAVTAKLAYVASKMEQVFQGQPQEEEK